MCIRDRNQSKVTSDDIKAKQSVAEKTEIEIDNVRKGYTSVRFSVLRCLHAVDATRVHLTMKWVIFFFILGPFGHDAPRRS